MALLVTEVVDIRQLECPCVNVVDDNSTSRDREFSEPHLAVAVKKYIQTRLTVFFTFK